jgi:hypothetical protein
MILSPALQAYEVNRTYFSGAVDAISGFVTENPLLVTGDVTSRSFPGTGCSLQDEKAYRATDWQFQAFRE